MKKIILPLLLLASVHAFADCIELSPSEPFQRVSDTQLVVTDNFDAKYVVTVDDCPWLSDDSAPIVTQSMDGQLCNGDVLEVEGDVCMIQSITPAVR